MWLRQKCVSDKNLSSLEIIGKLINNSSCGWIETSDQLTWYLKQKSLETSFFEWVKIIRISARTW